MQACISEAIGPPVTPAPNALIWHESDFGLSKNGANRVTQWLDETPNHYDVENTNTDAHRPLWVPNDTPNGLPSLDWGSNITGDSTTNKYLLSTVAADTHPPHPINPPITQGTARSVVAIIKPAHNFDDTLIGGNVICIRKFNIEWAAQMYTWTGKQLAQYDGGFYWNLVPVVDYTGKWICVSWTWDLAAATPCVVKVNGIVRPGVFGNAGNPIRSDTGGFGFLYGSDGGAGYTGPTLSGKLAACITRLGTDPSVVAIDEAYLTGKYGVSP